VTVQNVTIRSESADDAAEIRSVHESAFGRPHEGRLVDTLRGTEAFQARFSLVAEYELEVIGHILLYPIEILGDDGTMRSGPLSLGPLGVSPTYQNLGIGSSLVREGLERARNAGYESVIVLGHPDYYPRFGFRPASRWRIYPPFDVQDSHFMALELVRGALAGMAGVVVYPPPFDEV
jgi:putative acetyltransferase